ncbi:MAG: ABC transporter permease subunit, partial [Candidatus Dormiibacterota bacterium]
MQALTAVFGSVPTALLIFILVIMVLTAVPAILFSGTGFFGTYFSPGNYYLAPTVANGVSGPHGAVFGFLPEMLGTLVTSAIALGLAVPIAVGGVLMLTEWVPRWASGGVGLLLELLAGVPSVVFGLWGVLTFGPFMLSTVSPALTSIIGGFPWLFPWFPQGVAWPLLGVAILTFIATRASAHGRLRRPLRWLAAILLAISLWGAVAPWFTGEVNTAGGVLTASLVLALMVVPIIAATTRELVRHVPVLAKEGSLALGMTKHETARVVTIPYISTGVLATALLGWGRAIGETIAVFFIIGNIFTGIPVNIYHSGATLSSLIAGTLDGVLQAKTDVSALFAAGLFLLVISLLSNFGGRLIIRRVVGDRALPVGRGV